MKLLASTTAFIILCSYATATIRNVPAQYATIRAAINAAQSLDTVLVARGVYYENLNYFGRNIVLVSHYILTNDLADILETIIDGSQPADPDSGSVVAIISGESNAAELAGFTIQGGTGMPLVDDDNNLTYVEGGGIMVENSSPQIHHNLIINNEASRVPSGISSAGGGGIRVGFSSGAKILNNVLIGNRGRYGGGIVINYANAEVSNNIIALNSGGEDYGGGGLWVNGSNQTCVAHNNTIVGNSSARSGGGSRCAGMRLEGDNNIVWGNRANQGAQQIAGAGSLITLHYSCIQGGFAGEGNISDYPGFADSLLLLAAGSPCIDTGNPDPAFNDPDGSRNNMGAYGGPRATAQSFDSEPSLFTASSWHVLVEGIGWEHEIAFGLANRGLAALHVDSVRFLNSPPNINLLNIPLRVDAAGSDSVRFHWVSWDGILDTLLLFHNDPAAQNPLRILFDAGVASHAETKTPAAPIELRFLQNFPNPFNPETEIRYALPYAGAVTVLVYDSVGRKVATLADGYQAAGEHSVKWDAAGLPSGTYLCRLSAGSEQVTTKIILVK